MINTVIDSTSVVELLAMFQTFCFYCQLFEQKHRYDMKEIYIHFFSNNFETAYGSRILWVSSKCIYIILKARQYQYFMLS